MQSFTFRAVGTDGSLLRGELRATDRAAAVAQLQSRGALPLRVQATLAASPWARLERIVDRSQTLSAGQRADVLQRLATLIGSGVAVESALEILAFGQNPASVQHAVNDLLRQLREGAQLADAMARHKDSFPPLVVGMVRAGEVSGALPNAIARLADYLRGSEASRQAIRSALVYPIILIFTACFSILIVLLVVLPSLRSAIMTGGGTLPLPTRIAFAASDGLIGYGWILPLLAIVLAFVVHRAATDPALRNRRDGMILRVPAIGTAVRQAELARFARTLGVLVDGGVALPAALALSQPVIGNAVLARVLAEATSRLREGEGLAALLAGSKLIPSLAVQLVRIGEATGNLGTMLTQLADIFDADVRRTMDRGLAILVPLLTIGLGIVVASIVASVVIALLNVNELVG